MDVSCESFTSWIPGILVILLALMNHSIYKKRTGTEGTSLWMFLAMLVMTTCLPLCILTLIAFWFYHQIITLVLFAKHGTKFGGLLENGSVVHAWKGVTETPVHLLLIIQYQQTDSRDFYEYAREAICNKFQGRLGKVRNIFSTLENFLGYVYLLRNQATLDDCLKKLKIFKSPSDGIDKADLLNLLSEFSDVPLPKNRKVLWEVFIGSQPITRKSDFKSKKVKCYPIVIRYHHSLGDGRHFVKALQDIFADKVAKENGSHDDNFAKKELPRKRYLLSQAGMLLLVLKKLLINIYYICLLPSRYPPEEDSNILHGSTLTNTKIFSVIVSESANYNTIIKHIKSKIPGARFTDIFLTAFTASLQEYFEKNSTYVPLNISVLVPVHPEPPATLCSTKVGEPEKLECRNLLSTTTPRLPICINREGTKTPLVDRLRLIAKRTDISRKTFEYEMNDWLLNFVAELIPRPLLRHLVRVLTRGTALVTNLPGIPLIKVLGGCHLQEVVIWPANRELTGLGLAIHTYGGHLQLGLVVDKVLIPEQSKVDELLENINRNLYLLDRELENFATV